MRIAVCSDLHLEFGPIELQNTDKADVLVLSGDIMLAQDLHDHPDADPLKAEVSEADMKTLGSRQAKAYQYREFLRQVSASFPHVIYVAGNHEFYHGKWHGSLVHLREECAKHQNVYFLENDTKEIGDVTFVGATLWTDCNEGDPTTLHCLRDMMNDFRIIRDDSKGYCSLRPATMMYRHHQTLSYFKAVIDDRKDKKIVVVGHHAPSFNSVSPEFHDAFLMNGGYASELSEFILDRPQIKLWTHGHMHRPSDYMLGDTRIFANPRGYIGHQEQAETFTLKTVEV